MPKGTTTALTLKDVSTAKDMIQLMLPQIALALPKHLTPDRMARIMLTTLRLTPKLMQCSKESLAGAIIQASQLGWEPGSGMAQCAILPYKGEATLIPMYGGLIDLATRSGRVADVRGEVVIEGDFYELEAGSDAHIRHQPKMDRMTEPSFDDVILAYAVATMTNGAKKIEIVPKWKLIKIRAKSPSFTAKFNAKSPWLVWPISMCLKTAIKQICKFIPKSAELQAALQLDNIHETGKSQDLSLLLPPESALLPPAVNNELTESGDPNPFGEGDDK